MGKIKEGLGTLISNAGEYYVMAELLKRGYIAALAPRNAPAFDILATSPEKMVRIRVKTKSEEYDAWQWGIKKDGKIFRFLQEKEDFTILVNLAVDIKNMKYYIIPTPLLNTWLFDDFTDWINTPGRNGRLHSKENTKRNLSFNMHTDDLEKHKDNWNILWL